jgi:hypothetical protein
MTDGDWVAQVDELIGLATEAIERATHPELHSFWGGYKSGLMDLKYGMGRE